MHLLQFCTFDKTDSISQARAREQHFTKTHDVFPSTATQQNVSILLFFCAMISLLIEVFIFQKRIAQELFVRMR